MAVTENLYTGNGSTTTYSFTFPYLETTDIKVSVNGTPTTAYTLATATTIQFNTAPVNGAAIRIYRQTDDSALPATFYSGSAIRSSDLNDNFTQNLYVTQESSNNAATATTTANTALTNSNTAISTANTALSTANTASSNASAAVTTANTASTNASAAVSTANTASTNASAAVTTANSAAADAATALSTANTALSTANTASTNASAAVATANTASTNATAAVSTANTASSNASSAVSTANTASSNATTAVNTANSALSTANAAASAVANAILYDIVANVAAIPGSPVNNDAVEVTNSTGIESFTPLTGIPSGFVGDSGLSVRLVYTTTGSTWNWIQYFPNDPETRYGDSITTLQGDVLGLDNDKVNKAGDTMTGNLTAPALIPSGSTVPTNGVYLPSANTVAISTNGTGRLFVNNAGQVGFGDSSFSHDYSFYQPANTTLRIANSSSTAALNRGALIYLAGSDLSIANQETGFLRFLTSGSERIRIGANGEIGIGGANYGTSGQVLTSAGSGAAPSWQTPAAANTDKIEEGNTSAEVIDTGSDGRFVVTTEGTERARIDASGRLLVGTSSARANFFNSTLSAGLQLESTGENSFLSQVRITDGGGSAPVHILARARGSSVGSTTVVQSGDTLGRVSFQASDGTEFVEAAFIDAAVDGTPGANDMPGRLVFSTTADGASSPTERMRIDSSGRLLVGTSSSTTVTGSGYEGRVQIANSGNAPLALHGYLNSAAYGADLLFTRSRSSTIGTNTIVQSGDDIGKLWFAGANGTGYDFAASIAAQIDGTPGASGDMPGRLVFSTTADGASSPTEAMRINNGQELLVGYTTDNGAYKLQVNSQIFATSAIIATSDGRYKENVATLQGCVDLVKALRPVSFDWKLQKDITRIDDEGNEILVREGHNFPDGTQVGFIAQEVQQVLADKPWLGSVIKQNVRSAVTDNDGNELAPEEEFLGIAEGNLIAVLTSALQEAIGRIETLEAEVTALKA